MVFLAVTLIADFECIAWGLSRNELVDPSTALESWQVWPQLTAGNAKLKLTSFASFTPGAQQSAPEIERLEQGTACGRLEHPKAALDPQNRRAWHYLGPAGAHCRVYPTVRKLLV